MKSPLAAMTLALAACSAPAAPAAPADAPDAAAFLSACARPDTVQAATLVLLAG